MQELFQEFGEIESIFVQKDDKGTLRDSGFVCFKDPEAAEKAADAMNKKQIGEGQFLIVNRHISKKDNEILQSGSKIHPISQNLSKTFNSNVYVKFIPTDITEEELRKTFSEAGNIISVKIDKRVQRFGDQEIPQYQFAFILYEKVSDAQTSIRKFDNSNVFGSRPLKVELWLSKEEIEQQKKAKENREVHQILTQIIKGVGNMGVGPQTQPGQQFQGFPPGGVPQYGQYPGQQFQGQRGGNFRGGRGAPRGGRGGMHRGGMQPHMGMQGGFQGQPRMGYPNQMRPQGNFPPMGGMPAAYQQHHIALPAVDQNEYQSLPDLDSRKQFIGNHIYPSIE